MHCNNEEDLSRSVRVATVSSQGQQLTRTLFGTPIFIAQCAGMVRWNTELSLLILGLERGSDGIRQSNAGGWQSKKNLHEIKHEAVDALVTSIKTASDVFTHELVGEQYADRCRVIAWANVNRKNDFNTLHYHIGGFWSGVYYVATAPVIGTEGIISFRNPASSAVVSSLLSAPPALMRISQSDFAVRPTEGMLLIFPSWLEHFVYPHTSELPRISIAFDLIYR